MLSRIPAPRRLFNQLGIFRHGYNAQAEYAYDVFEKHFARVNPKPGFTCLELGPGDALASAVFTPAFGGSGSIQVDVAPFAREEIDIYLAMEALAKSRGRNPPSLAQVRSLNEILSVCNGEYLTSGLSSLREIPTASVDFVYSQAALEHVRANEFLETMKEMRRTMRTNGVASHHVDLKDHLDQGLNNLRFSDGVWESDLMAGSGFYTNRISCSEMKDLMEEAGFVVEIEDVRRWPVPPLPRKALAPRFRDRSDHDLTISGFVAVCRPR
ncbi:MAG: methyltransferase domain-containing protein [Brevundimonas sp.]|uniref:class I SAM-dependent methyltransferase n=1 Tax=Brevundimonas sp. TaxID=1871086 RepID=UPI0027368510|nr:methyltransferase domain-containing protein [Brevundimonas sp.]MDP2763455.1 methyltransferase domain-containing protein [Brevundimonas sp.]MDZ4111755.1 methyltransferase domain-containing protein [Brevundimonas sp.]MDZ4321863.1 methyltransferase domain-containing protein [Phenylobacterium sp.]